MLSIAAKYLLSTIAAIGFFVPAFAAPVESAPLRLRDPVLGLEYDRRTVQFEPLSESVRLSCREYSRSEHWGSRLWIYARTKVGDRTYYAVGGYFERKSSRHGEARFIVDTQGGVIAVSGIECTGYGQARAVFDARNFEEMPKLVLQALAQDYARRLTIAFGDQLVANISANCVDINKLTPELESALREPVRRGRLLSSQ